MVIWTRSQFLPFIIKIYKYFCLVTKIISIKVDNINGSLTIQEHSNIQFLHFKREKKGFDQIFRARN